MTKQKNSANTSSNYFYKFDEYLDDYTDFDDHEIALPKSQSQESKSQNLNESLIQKSTPKPAQTFRLDYENAKLNYAKLAYRQLSFINVISSSFRYAHFEAANMIGANLATSDFHSAKFRHADLSWAEISDTNLSAADMTSVNLQGATISNCDFQLTNLKGANLSECKLKSNNFTGAIYDRYTRLPFSADRAREMGMIQYNDSLHQTG